MWGSGSHLLQLSLRFFLSFNRFQNCFLWSHFQLQALPPHHRKYHLSLQMQIGHGILAWLFQTGESRASFSVVFGVLVSCSWLNLVLQLLREAERPQPEAQHWWNTVVMRDTHKGQTAHLYSFKVLKEGTIRHENVDFIPCPYWSAFPITFMQVLR